MKYWLDIYRTCTTLASLILDACPFFVKLAIVKTSGHAVAARV
jgi:hypothetical protein